MLDWLKKAVAGVRRFAYAPPRPAARIVQPRLGLALGGGFARGIAHIGVLRVLEENGIPVHAIAGTSVGALIGAAYACGTPLAAMEERARATRFKDFARWTLSWLGLASNLPLESYLRKMCIANRFEELKLPLAIAATDLETGEPVYFTSGELGPALRASCAYPGLFLPVEHGGRTLVDGFLAAPVPVEALRTMGADLVVAVYLATASPDGKPRSVADVIGRSFSIMQRHAHQNWRRDADLVIEPDVTAFAWDDFEKTPEMIAAGEAAARAAVPKLRAMLAPPAPARTASTPAYR
jgi:NTE family protein